MPILKSGGGLRKVASGLVNFVCRGGLVGGGGLIGGGGLMAEDYIGSVTTWEDLVEKFVQKFYQLTDNNEEVEIDEDDSPDNDVEMFKIEGNLFDFETPLCKAFNEFNYLLKIDTDLFSFDIPEFKTCEGYELNNMIGNLEEPWSNNGVPYQLCDHICEPYQFKNEMIKWPMRSSDIDGFCNGGELPRMEANWAIGRPKAKMSLLLAHPGWPCDTQDYQEHKEKHEEHMDNPTHEPPVCKIRRCELMKYSFNADEQYISVKESEYLNHSNDNLDAYRELLRIIDDGWLVDAIRRILGFGIQRIDYLHRPCCKEIDDMEYSEKDMC
nr:hypothetical protein [Tanacetum cinerariifolium]